MDAAPPKNALAEPTPASAKNAEAALIVRLFLLCKNGFVFASFYQRPVLLPTTDQTLARVDDVGWCPVLKKYRAGKKLGGSVLRGKNSGSGRTICVCASPVFFFLLVLPHPPTPHTTSNRSAPETNKHGRRTWNEGVGG